MGSVNSRIYFSAPCIASHEKITLPIISSVAPFSGESNLKQGIGVSVGVLVTVGVRVLVGVEVLVDVGVFVAVCVGVVVGVSSVLILQAARTSAHRDVQLIFRNSLLDRGDFFMFCSRVFFFKQSQRRI